MNFQLLIESIILKNNGLFLPASRNSGDVIIQQCWHFNIYELDQFHVQLSWAWKKIYCLVARDHKPWKHFILLIFEDWSIMGDILFWYFFYVPDNSFSVISGRVFLGWTSTKHALMCLAQGLNPVTPVRLEPAAPRSRVKHYTTEPLRSLLWALWC